MANRISDEELRKIVGKATPAPWMAQTAQWPEQIGCCPIPGRPFSVHHEMRNVAAATTFADARLIALAPALAAEVLQLREALSRIRDDSAGWQRDTAQEALSTPSPVIDAVKQGDA